ncbi:MAG: hypothetical protein KAW88_02115 [Candidatus Cloacimonetes bacterium]|nr:hypothetical protein [Candidatus Cloacimonadota bacterium]
MKTLKIVLTLVVLVLSISLNAGTRIEGLGNYFEYLIRDIETDIALFPAHLIGYDNKHIQFVNNGKSTKYYGFHAKDINLSIMPLAKKVFLKINANIASDNRQPRIYLSEQNSKYYYYNKYGTFFRGDDFGASLITTTLAHSFSNNFLVGCFLKYGNNWRENISEDYKMTDPNTIINEDVSDSDFYDDFYSAGINFRIGSNLKTDITLMFSQNFMNESYYNNFDFVDFYSSSSNNHSYQYIEKNSQYLDQETEDIGICVLLDVENDKSINRFFMESHYTQLTFDLKLYDSRYRLYYENDELDDEHKDIHEQDKKEERKIYTATLGFGKTIKKNKWNLHYGIKFDGLYGDTKRDESYYDLDYDLYVYQDTIQIDSVSASGQNNFKIKDWKAVLKVPFGVSYNLNKLVQLYVGVGFKLIRQKFEYFDDNEFNRWETDRYQSFGATISPIECLKIDVNFAGTLTGYSSWQIDVKYLW